MKIMRTRQSKSLRVIGMTVALSVGIALVAAHAPRFSRCPFHCRTGDPGCRSGRGGLRKIIGGHRISDGHCAQVRPQRRNTRRSSVPFPGSPSRLTWMLPIRQQSSATNLHFATLHAQHLLWQRTHQQISDELAKPTQRAAGLHEALGRLENLRESWALTL